MPFSTYDRDNDNHHSNCAANMGGGWWFNACHAQCLTATYGTHSYRWYTNTTDDTLSGSVMMIRRREN